VERVSICKGVQDHDELENLSTSRSQMEEEGVMEFIYSSSCLNFYNILCRRRLKFRRGNPRTTVTFLAVNFFLYFFFLLRNGDKATQSNDDKESRGGTV